MRKLTGLVCLALALSACSDRSGAEEAVRQSLKDPDSAKFGAFYYNPKTRKACLTTNGKNSMGGYTGDQQAELTKEDSGWQVLAFLEIDHETCKSYHADVPDNASDAGFAANAANAAQHAQ